MSMDFAALPPEVNSGRMYTGAGSGPMLTAAEAWEGLASQLESAASSYQSVISGLTGQTWHGPASASMAAAATPHAAWMHTTSGQARHAATQARSAAAAYEEAFAATVPPPLIAENQARSQALIATNLLGQNTPAIAANQAHYGEMWAQDASAMYSYAGTTAAATKLSPFAEPKQNSDSGSQAQAAAAGQSGGDGGSSAVPDLLQGLSSGGDPSQGLINMLTSQPVEELLQLNGNLAPIQGVVGGMGTMLDFMGFGAIPLVHMGVVFGQGFAGALAGSAAPASATSPMTGGTTGSILAGFGAEAGTAGVGGASASAGLGGSGVAAGAGRAAAIGGLSVPQTWGTPPVQLASSASPLPQAGPAALPQAAPGAAGGFGGMPPMGSVVNASQNGQSRSGSTARLKAAMDGSSEGGKTTAGQLGLPTRGAPTGQALSTERDELNRLRKAVGQMAKERDRLKRSAASILIEDSPER